MRSRLISGVFRKIDGIYWKEADGDTEILHERTEALFRDRAIYKGDPRFVESMAQRAGMEQEEYIGRIRGGAYLDPRAGWVIRSDGRIPSRSLPYSYNAAKPSAIKWLFRKASGLKKLDRCISFRDVHETNYYHFFNDVLAKIPLLQDHGLLDAPIVISGTLYRKPFFQAVLPKLLAAGLEVIDQGNDMIHCNEVIYCKAMPLSRDYLDRVMDLIEAPTPGRQAERKIFLTRRPSGTAQRLISNMEQVEATVREFGFEVIDPGDLPLYDQMALLGDTRWLIGIHGAGLTNMIFRRGAPLDVMEIFPAESMPPHYCWLAHVYGYGHRAMLGGTSGRTGRFHVSIDRLTASLAIWTKGGTT